jgi:HD-like signal output (HDOD) protein
VTDVRMDGMDGFELLAEIKQRSPGAVRIALSGHLEEGSSLRAVGLAHQFSIKPCSMATLQEAIVRATSLRRLLARDDLKRLVASMASLPSVPAPYTQLVKECQGTRNSLKIIGELVADDIGMTAQILHLANSAFFGRSARVTDPVRAVQLLGLETVKALALTSGVFSQFAARRMKHFSLDQLWRHSLITHSFARIITRTENADPSFADDASVAGLVHDAGQLVLAANLPDRYEEALLRATEGGVSLADAESSVFGATHASVGAYLLSLWGLPERVVEAVAFHDSPTAARHRAFTPLAVVHVADALAHPFCAAPGSLESPVIDSAHLARLGLADRLEAWERACRRFADDH